MGTDVVGTGLPWVEAIADAFPRRVEIRDGELVA